MFSMMQTVDLLLLHSQLLVQALSCSSQTWTLHW
jgi:hypothetical protein